MSAPQKCIIVAEVFPPIPTRRFDYCAYIDGDEERQEYGYGPTREAAIADLREVYPDACDGANL